jgi:hypothetical protein
MSARAPGPTPTRRLAPLVLIVQAALAACGAPEHLELPSDGRCDAPDVWKWATMASDSLSTLPFKPRPMFQADDHGAPVPFSPGPCAGCEAVRSYPAPHRHEGGPPGFERMATRSFVYDNALYALLRTAEGRQSQARAVLDTLVALQREDGGWGFSFDLVGGFYDAGYVRTGAVAWVLYAMARYDERFGEGRYRQPMRRAGRYLAGQLDGKRVLLRGGYGRWVDDGGRFERTYVASWMSTEHNIDAVFALEAARRVDPEGDWKGARAISAAIESSLYLPERGHYGRGMQPGGVDTVVALDAAGTWSALFELARGRPARALDLISRVDALLGGREGPWRTWRPGDDAKGATWFVEGSVARALALHRAGRSAEARADLEQLARWGCAAGLPLTYSSKWVRDFPRSPAVAPTVWFALAAREVQDIAAPFLWSENLR